MKKNIVLLFSIFMFLLSGCNLSVKAAIPQALNADAKIIFNPTGTNLTKDQLQIRLDIYFGETSKTYSQQYVFAIDETSKEFLVGYKGIDDPIEFQNWLDSLPHIWRLNPAICLFIDIDNTTSLLNIQNYIEQQFNANTLVTLDNLLFEQNSAHLISPYLKNKLSVSKEKTISSPLLINNINSKFSSINITGSRFSGQVQEITSQSIDVGGGAINRVGAQGYNTQIDKTNPANDTGILDTFETWLVLGCTSGGQVGTAYSSGSNFTTRDYENIGSISSGSKQTFSGKNCDVSINDFAFINVNDGGTEYSNSGGGGTYGTLTTTNAPFTNVTFTAIDADSVISFYATGIETSLFIPQIRFY